MTTAVQDRLDLTANTDESDKLTVVKNYLKLPDSVTVDDDLLSKQIQAAKEDADEYLNNPFTEVKGQIVVGSPDNGETVQIDSETFTKAASTSVEDREFADASGLVSCVNSNLISVNGEDIGIPYLTAENDTGTVTLTSSKFEKPDISTSDETELKVRYKRIKNTIPEAVADAVLKQIARRYVKRIDGLKSENSEHGGSGSMDWKEIKREYLAPYRLNPGI